MFFKGLLPKVQDLCHLVKREYFNRKEHKAEKRKVRKENSVKLREKLSGTL